MHYRIFSILVTFVCLFGCALTTAAQDVNNTDETEKPVILYSGTPKKYEIADIKVEGAQNYEDYVIVGLSGLSKGNVYYNAHITSTVTIYRKLTVRHN